MWWHVLAAAQETSGDSGVNNVAWAQILLSIVGPAGLVGSIVALLKLKPDANSQAVVQAQGAAAEWEKIAAERLRERDHLQKRLDEADGEIEKLERAIQKLEQEIQRYRRQHPRGESKRSSD